MERIEQLNALLQQEPEDNFLLHALALEYIKMGDDATAHHLFEGILTRDPAYVPSYYHLAKLLERAGEETQAIQWYKRGMNAAQTAGDKHAYNELRAACEELEF